LIPPRCWSTIRDDDDHLWICMRERNHEVASDHLSNVYLSLSGNPPALNLEYATEQPKIWPSKLPPIG
jgi:hypothetical protein